MEDINLDANTILKGSTKDDFFRSQWQWSSENSNGSFYHAGAGAGHHGGGEDLGGGRCGDDDHSVSGDGDDHSRGGDDDLCGDDGCFLFVAGS